MNRVIEVTVKVKQPKDSWTSEDVFTAKASAGEEMTALTMRSKARELMREIKAKVDAWTSEEVEREQAAAEQEEDKDV